MTTNSCDVLVEVFAITRNVPFAKHIRIPAETSPNPIKAELIFRHAVIAL